MSCVVFSSRRLYVSFDTRWFGDIHRTRRLVAEFSKRRCRRSARGMSIKKIRWPVNGLLMGPTIQAHVFAPVSLFPSDVTINWLSIQIFRFTGRFRWYFSRISTLDGEWMKPSNNLQLCVNMISSWNGNNILIVVEKKDGKFYILALVNKGIIL